MITLFHEFSVHNFRGCDIQNILVGKIVHFYRHVRFDGGWKRRMRGGGEREGMVEERLVYVSIAMSREIALRNRPLFA